MSRPFLPGGAADSGCGYGTADALVVVVPALADTDDVAESGAGGSVADRGAHRLALAAGHATTSAEHRGTWRGERLEREGLALRSVRGTSDPPFEREEQTAGTPVGRGAGQRSYQQQSRTNENHGSKRHSLPPFRRSRIVPSTSLTRLHPDGLKGFAPFRHSPVEKGCYNS